MFTTYLFNVLLSFKVFVVTALGIQILKFFLADVAKRIKIDPESFGMKFLKPVMNWISVMILIVGVVLSTLTTMNTPKNQVLSKDFYTKPAAKIAEKYEDELIHD